MKVLTMLLWSILLIPFISVGMLVHAAVHGYEWGWDMYDEIREFVTSL